MKNERTEAEYNAFVSGRELKKPRAAKGSKPHPFSTPSGLPMTVKSAAALLGYSLSNSTEYNAKLAAQRLATMNDGAPLRYQVACSVLLNAAR